MNPTSADRDDPKYLIPLRAYWGRYIEVGMGSLFINTFALATPFFSMLIYDKVVGNNITDTMWALSIGMILFALLDFVLRTIRSYYVEQIAIRSDLALDNVIINRLLGGDVGKTPPVGAVLAGYRDLTSAREFLSAQSIMVVADLPFTVIYIIALIIVGGWVVVAPLFIGALVVTLQAMFSVPTRDYQKLSRTAEATKLGLLSEMLSNNEAYASTRLGEGFRKRWQIIAEKHSVSNGKSRFWSALSMSLAMSGNTLVYVVTIIIGVYMIEAQAMTMGGLVAGSMLASRALANISQAVTLFTKFKHLRSSHDALSKLVDLRDAESAREIPPAPVEGRIFARGVTHRFRQEGLPALEGASFGIEPGEKVGLLGRPGSGKTTLVRALAGVIHPTAGDVLVDGVPVNRYLPEERSDWLVYKPQEALLFAGSLEENVRAGNTTASAAQVMEALAGAGLREAIRTGELSLGHEIAPYGTNLSGGQRQAIALARALLSPARIVLLDEPTSGFDIPTEQQVAQYLKTWAEGRTLILATHSPLLLNVLCDRLLVVNGGKIVADGPRQKILQG